jgi:hypothetical protein
VAQFIHGRRKNRPSLILSHHVNGLFFIIRAQLLHGLHGLHHNPWHILRPPMVGFSATIEPPFSICPSTLGPRGTIACQPGCFEN